jgi:drug/metabolite transporter (DMT)-like permease
MFWAVPKVRLFGNGVRHCYTLSRQRPILPVFPIAWTWPAGRSSYLPVTPPPSSPAEFSLRPYLAMLAAAAAFTVMGGCAHALGKRCDWQIAMIARSVIPMLLSGGLAVAGGARLVFWGPRSLWLRSIAGSLSMMGAFFAFTRLPVSQVLTLTNLYPIWVAVLSWPFLGKIPGLDIWIAAVTGVAGVVLIEQPDSPGAGLASTAAFFSSLMSGFAMIGLHRLKAIDPRSIVAHFSLVSLLTACTALCLFDRVRPGAVLTDPGTLLLLVGVGLSATLGQFLLTIAFTTGPAAQVAVVGLVQVAFGMLTDVVLWHQSFSPITLLGTLLVIGPTAWVMLRRSSG